MSISQKICDISHFKLIQFRVTNLISCFDLYNLLGFPVGDQNESPPFPYPLEKKCTAVPREKLVSRGPAAGKHFSLPSTFLYENALPQNGYEM